MTEDRKKFLAEMVKRKADVFLETTGQPYAIPQFMSVADAHLSEEDINFVIEESIRLARAPSPR